MKMKALLAGVVGLLAASAAHAATITFTLVTGIDNTGAASPNSFVVYGKTSAGDNAGLAAYQFGLSNITEVFSEAPIAIFRRANPAPRVKTAGFNLYTDSSSAASVRGAQDTASYDTNIANGTTQTIDLVYGFGQTGGDLSTRSNSPFAYSAPESYNTAYSGQLLLASGTFNVAGALPQLTYGNGNIFTSAVAPGTTSNGTVQTINNAILVQPVVPEPASLAAIGLAGLGLMARRRSA